MKKKVFSLMMTLLLAFVGVAKAEIVEIGVGGVSTNSYLPNYEFYNYSLTQQIYTADEIGTAGTINSIAFFYTGTATRTLDVYMVNTTVSSFASNNDWITVTAADKVYSGEVTYTANEWNTLVLDTPFAYDGTSNLAVIVDDNTGSYVSSVGAYVFDATGMSIRIYNDYTDYDPLAPPMGSGAVLDVKNQIQLDITPGGGGGAGAPYEAQIGEGTSTTGYFPFYTLYNYSIAENLFLASELQAAGVVAGPVTSLSWYATNETGYEQQGISIWMANVSDTELTTTSHVTTGMTLVYTGAMTPAIGWNEFPCNAGSFSWDGASNVLIFCQRNNGDWNSTVSWQAGGVGFTAMSYRYQDSGAYDVTVPNTMYTSTNRSNIIIKGVGAGGSGTGDQLFAMQNGEDVETIVVGTRPNGYWMEPFTFQLRNDGPATTVNVIDFTPTDYFTLVAPELPFDFAHDEIVDVQLSTGAGTATEWQMAVLYGTGRTARVWDIVAEPYDPATPDVWELACEEATSFPFVEVPATAHNTTLHNDYTLPFPEIEEGLDAVYKLVFDGDQILNAEVTSGANGKVALYTEDFYGEGGPMATNNYTGLAAPGSGGSGGAPFQAQIGEGTTTSTYFPFHSLWNYSLAENLFLASELTEAGVTTAPMTSLSWYVSSTTCTTPQNGINIWMANVSDAELTTTSHITAGMTLVYSGNNVLPVAGEWNEFEFNQGNFAWDGHSNVLIVCQRLNGSWQGSISWQTHNPGFTAMAYDYDDYEIYNCQTTSYTMYTSATNRANIIMKANGRGELNRDTYTYGFETGLDGWTVIDVNADEGTWLHSSQNLGGYDYTTLAHGGTGFAMCYSYVDYVGSFDTDSYLVSPQKYSIGTGSTLTFWADNANDSYPESFSVCVATANNPTANDFIQVWSGDAKGRSNGNAEVRHMTNRYENWRSHTIDLSAYAGQEVWIAFHDVNYDMYEIWIDDVTITANGGVNPPTPPTPPTPGQEYVISAGPVIENLPVTPGTYYLVASSTDPDFEVTINAEDMPCPPVDGFAFNPTPADNENEVEPGSVTLRWMVPDFATGWRLIFGTTYHPEPNHPQTIMYPEDGSFSPNMANSYTVRNLFNNTNYFWRVEFNNSSCAEGVSSPVWGFTTHLNIPQNLTAVDYTVFDDETIVLNWNAVQDRTYRQYFIYRDGVKVGETAVNQINATTYTDGPLAYNMDGYTYYVTAVYDEGESAPSDPVTVKVSGYGDVDGHVYEQDGETGIAGATVTMVGTDEFNVSHTYNFQTNAQGYYSGHIYAGEYNGSASRDGYQTIDEPVQGNPVVLNYNQTTSPVDYMLDENFDPVCTVIAEYYPDSLDPNSPYVKVYWGCGLPGEEIIEPFETGDFSLFPWNITGTYPWEVTTTHPYEGNYCMRSTNYNVASSTSSIDVTVNIPGDGIMSFYAYISSESSWDYGYFYIDGVQKGSYTGAGNSWGEKKFDITAGDHNFKWEYTKDGSVNSNEDRFYIDYICFYKRPEPAQPGWHTYCESEFNNAVGSNLTTTPSWAYEYPTSFLHTNYAGWQITKVSLFSDNMYSAVGGNYTCRIYVGGSQPAAGTMVSELTVDVPSNQNAWVDWDLPQAVNVTGNDPIYVVWTANTTVSSWPAGCCGDLNDYGTWWEGGSGWEHLTYGTWTMRHWFTNRAGRSVALGTASNAFVAESPINSKLRTFVKGEESNAICANPNAVKGAALENGNTRAFAYYRVYRTDCYNDGPYTTENTELLASEVTDTVYIDTYWPDVLPGIYKWGVGCVYSGNRGELYESSITWTAPTVVRDATADNTTNPVVGESNGVRAPWDLMMTFSAPEGGHYGVAYDGNNFYTSNWGYSAAAYNFYKYDLSGNMLEGFNITGCGTLRGMTYDGQYFYGVANSATVYCVDLANHSVVSTFTSAYGAQRGITYDPQRDGFWVIGNWSGNLTLIDRTGAIQFTGPAPTSASDLAYYKDENNVEHVYCFNNGTNDVEDYNITTNTMGGSVFNFNAAPGATGTSGGCTVADFNGKTAFIGDLQQTPNLIAIYELKDATPGGGGGGSQGGNTIQEPRESEIVWSNCLDKDMYLTDVDVTVLLNSADSPEGAVVKFENYNEYEQQTYPIADITMDETGYYPFVTFRRGAYKVIVEKEGYETIVDSINLIDYPNNLINELHLRYVMIEILYGVENVYVSRTGWAMWDDNHNNPGGGGGQGGSGDTFEFGFENGLEGWTNIDADGDGEIWYNSIESEDYHCVLEGTPHGGSHMVNSESYCNCTGALYPDNYLVSPQKYHIANGSTFTLWASGQDASYAAEHFGVAVSTGSNTNAGDFTMLQEWTLTAKDAPVVKEEIRGNRAQGTWYQKTVDLSAYAGQDVYIAIRHFNVTDQFILCIDDIALTNGAKNTNEMEHFEYYKVLCTSIDGVPIYNHNTVHPFCQLSTDEPYMAPLVEGDHYLIKVASVYSTGISPWSEPVEWEYEPCDHWGPVDEVTVSPTGQGNLIEWVFENGYNPYGGGGGGGGGGTGTGEWYYYDNGVNVDAIGLTSGGSFYWGVMFPAGSYTGNQVTKVSMYDYEANNGNILVYQGGTNAPGTLVGQQAYTCTGSNDFVEWTFATPANIDPTQNLWIVMNNSNGQYVASCCNNTGDANGRWISLDGAAWEDVASYGLDYTWMLRAYVFDGAKGNYYGAPTMASSMISNDAYALNITEIENFDERVIYLYNLVNDDRFNVINGEQNGVFIVSLDNAYEGNLNEMIKEFSAVNAENFAKMDKEEASATALNYKAQLPFEMAHSLMMDIYVKSRENALCADAYPFCTDNGMYEFPAGVNAGSGEAGPDYNCLYTTPNPAWYYMRIGNPGDIDIYMYSTPSVDIDFCCWGPFDDPTTPCPNGLTSDKVVSCSYSANPTENCIIPSTAQTGEYYILIITNYSNQPCNINFSKVSGSGDTDCGILPPVDIIGFLITQDGEYLAFADPTDREYTDIDEFGEHEYCVRPIYPGEMTLPSNNFGWSMGCPVCAGGGGGQVTCEPGDDIDYSYAGSTDEVTVFWGEQIIPLEEWLYYDDGTYATSVGAGGTIYWGTMFPAASLQPYAGTSLTKVAVHTSYACSATVNIYLGGNTPGGSPAATQTFTMPGDQEFTEITLNNPVAVDGTQNLWIIFYQSGETYPADACSDTGDANNRWVSLDGSTWYDLAEAGLPGYGWMVRGFVTNQAKGGALVSLPEFKGNVGTELSHSAVVSKPADMSFMNRDRAEIVKYNVYRSTDNETYELVGEVAAVAGQTYYEYTEAPATGHYFYQVRAYYDNGCESEPAFRKNAHQYNYVEVDVTGVGENNGMAVYPNPTSGNVTIEANGMQHITVVSTLGQVVFDADVDTDHYILNMSQYVAGMYTVRVTTENGVSVNRITVVR